jgi:hypothetical protein
LEPPDGWTPGWWTYAGDVSELPDLSETIVDALVEVLEIAPTELHDALMRWP